MNQQVTENISEMGVDDEVKKINIDFGVNQSDVVERIMGNTDYDWGKFVDNDKIGVNNVQEEIKYVMLQTTRQLKVLGEDNGISDAWEVNGWGTSVPSLVKLTWHWIWWVRK